MKKILLVLFAFPGIVANAQNYQTIYSNDINYFGTKDSAYYLATRIDSVDLVEGDSIYYGFQTARLTESPSCFREVKPAWFGEKIVLKPDGVNVYFNEENDSIFIHTLAELNDTFLVYTYPTGEWIKGRISSIEMEGVLGVTDFVKTIELFSNHPDFNLYPARFKISKSYGFTEVFPFYSFPEVYEPAYESEGDFLEPMELVGSDFPKEGITRLTIGEIHDHEIGDEIKHFSTQFHSFFLNTDFFYREKYYTGKTSWGADSVEYEVYVIARNEHYSESMELLDLYEGSDTLTHKIYDLNNYLHDQLPEEYRLDFDPDVPFEGALMQTTLTRGYCGKLIETENNITNLASTAPGDPELPGTCLQNWHFWGSSIFEDYAYEGLGKYHFRTGFMVEEAFGISLNGAIKWYLDEDGNCGSNFFIGLAEEETSKVELNCYPNPVMDLCHIQFNTGDPNATYQFELIDLTGRVCYQDRVEAGTFQSGYLLDMSLFQSGNYFIRISNDVHLVTGQLIKQ